MLIINADDLGRNHAATMNIVTCYRQGLITSASAMVYMSDSHQAAESAKASGLETGLHINLTEKFDGPGLPPGLQKNHSYLVKYFRKRKWTQLLYNPFVQKKVDYVFKAQLDEYHKLFSEEPAHFNGHHHMHLCMNMILGRTIPPRSGVRRNFSFERAEKNALNRLYRRFIDNRLVKRYYCTDYFYSLESDLDLQRLKRIINLAFLSDVEIMTHPEKTRTLDFLWSPQYWDLVSEVPKGTYRLLVHNRRETSPE
jgi:hypothetical protein